MKRKLDENDVPAVEVPTSHKTTNGTPIATFDSMNLDARLLQALAKSGFSAPTPVQAQAIPLANEGKNILAKSKTGSGKTAAYVLPCLQSILLSTSSGSKNKSTSVLVLVPTRELSDQVTRVFASLGEFCGKDVRALNLTQKVSEAVLAAKLNEVPNVIVSTPGKVGKLLENSSLSFDTIQKLVIDEADLVLSYGYEEDIEKISKALPKGVQTFLISATLTPEVDLLRQTFAQDYVTVNIEDEEEKGQDMRQYIVKCTEEDKFLLIFVIFKLKLVKGKCIIFVADVDRSYRLKLYLEQFGIKSCILNSELPVNSRLHAVQEFNKGLYDILIAADDQEIIGGIKRKSKKATEDEEAEDDEVDDENETAPKSTKSKSQKDFGISRGIDFQNVSSVLNFDLPTSSRSYTHRIGRTARAGKSGMALSFVIPKDQHGKHKYTTIPSTRYDERVLEKIRVRQAKKGAELKNYEFNMSQVEGFRYRMHDALKAVTPNKIREARTREIRLELLKSEKLAKHFEENPEDLKALRHDTSSSAGIVKVQGHMKHVPDYLLPGGPGKKRKVNDGTGEFVSFNKDERDKRKAGRGGVRGKGRGGRSRGGSGRRVDVLKSLKTRRK
ncbi:ATP-dependent DNA/RNA helicase [Neophaeococcomyces mojaviensis]|uniref:ATP-dependent DNA/RNA helicase n=1 Tax=Neophaeococcomyces mojaviensis TaxID=3383035 RepID=A0ACC3A8W7_9EURO|nr:ATP-dependent DNA/RNA helicase [Knufia sp. JES_112]